MSSLTNADCERGHVSQQPPILYSPSKEETAMKASRKTIKIKTPEGEVKVAVLGDSPGAEAEEYLQHISNFIRMLGRKKIEEDMAKLAKAVLSSKAQVRKLKTAPQGEKPAEKTARLGLLKAATTKLVESEVCEDAKMATVYDRGSGPFVPSNFFFSGAPLFPIFFVLAGKANTQKQTDAKQRSNKERPFFCQDDNPPPHRRNFPIDLQQRWSINRKIGDRQWTYYSIVRALTVAVLLLFLFFCRRRTRAQ